MREATGGLAEVRTLRPRHRRIIAFAPHDGELVFGFVLEGSATLDYAWRHALGAARCVRHSAGRGWSLTDPSTDFRLLHVRRHRLA